MKSILEVRRADLSDDKTVLTLLNANKKYKICVCKDGTIFYVKNESDPRFLNQIVGAVKSASEDSIAKQVEVSPLDFGKWKESLSSATLSKTSTLLEKNPNDTLRFIFEKAVRAHASDVYFYIGKKGECSLEFKTYGFIKVEDTFSFDHGIQLASIMWTTAESQYDKTKPCDVSFDQIVDGKEYRIRANSMPTASKGNTIACRIRDPKVIQDVHSLGYNEVQNGQIKEICATPGGLILFTGATNSGKSTSVTAIMGNIPKSQHMIEIADPVEIELDECTHVQLDKYHKDADKIFEDILGCLVRQNPDVLILGEIRDRKTAEAAISMAIQGKKVLSTLHSTSAASVFTRLKGLGVTDDVLALPEFLAGIVSQSLAPIPCEHCGFNVQNATKYFEDKGGEDLWLFEKACNLMDNTNLRFVNTAGCEHCLSGVAGQTLVAEVYPLVNDQRIGGGVHKMISDCQFHLLPDYMKKNHQVIHKAEHAVQKCLGGWICPVLTMKILGSLEGGIVQKSEGTSALAA